MTKLEKLFIACELEQRDTVELLIKQGANINARNNDGITALMKSAIKGNTEIAKLLLKAGAIVNLKEYIDGWTALMYAIIQGYTKVVKLLIQAGSDVNIKDNIGLTTLMYAVRNNYTDIAKILIEAGADVNYRHYNLKDTALSMATNFRHNKIVKLLTDAGAKE